ncbi:DUF6144 family protein [Gaoshiqia sediminis]|uniref:DUF6144 family protein n=1 Tax=Gaoshiqia sediminis TaxID=2986998 RepID=A0AA42C7H8_9BACT|nr:DUF6144 family protein [Gaoshiqia sediminis]MCW0481606.1 DUF6144 family protein [Gaoshiqia sediminis]
MTNNNRRNFLKKACTAGGCFCGFSFFSAQKLQAESDNDAEEAQKKLMQEWISTLMLSLDEQTDEKLSRLIMKKCARVHYDQLKMDDILQDYVGNPKKFIQFLKDSWNWKVIFDEQEQIILADENKNYCVCPMVDHTKGVKSSVLCYCSEGFAELMFAKVAGHPVEARVISSIHRGDDRCQYQIKLS